MSERLVYFIQCAGDERQIKIGVCGNVPSRLGMMISWSPHKLELLAQLPGDECLEGWLHDQFKEARIRGEWFKPVPALIETIKTVQETGKVPGFDVERYAIPKSGWQIGLRKDSRLGEILAGLDIPVKDLAEHFGHTRQNTHNWMRSLGPPIARIPAILDFLEQHGARLK